jgi:ketosteroid isomerase-like protein
MKNYMFFLLLLSLSLQARAQSTDEAAIRQLLDKQTRSWNNGQIEEFMHGYWENDSLMFIGKSGIAYGYSKTLENYKKGYPDTAAMGKLNFTLLEVKRLSDEYYFVIGKWFLKRSIGDVGGHFTLLFRKIRGQWFIIADHSS